MPNDDDWLAENLDWSDRQERLFENMAHETNVLDDEMLQQVFQVGFFDFDVDHENRMAAREFLMGKVDRRTGEVIEPGYIQEHYGFNPNDYFDWEMWREMYGES